MRPDENDDRRLGTPLIPQRAYVHTPPSSSRKDPALQQTAAANIVRGQINALYDTATPEQSGQPAAAQPAATINTQPASQQQQPAAPAQQPIAAAQPAQQPAADATQQSEPAYVSAYQQTQSNPAQIQPDQWKQYHSAWQDYYQKYYERYYVGQVHRAQQSLQARTTQATQQPVGTLTAADTNAPAEPVNSPQPASMSREEALYDLRGKLRDQIQTSAVKVRKSRHFIPITAAICVMMVFLFLQYNRVLFANVEAYISPGNIDPANVIIDPSSQLSISKEPKLIIPKINVDVPVDYKATPDYDSQMASMQNGLAYFGIPGANSKPGQIGNTVISGHSSNDIIDQGQYKFIFARLDVLKEGDTIYANYKGKRYVYVVTKKEVVKPSQVSKLVYKTDKPIMTLITCTPLGTALNRLLVTAEQISPNPAESAAKPAPEQSSDDVDVAMPGNSPTFLQRIFGGGN